MKTTIKQNLEELRAELDTLPEPRSARVKKLLEEVETELGGSPESSEPGLLDSIRQMVEEFEVEHPRTTAVLNDILIKLESMGI